MREAKALYKMKPDNYFLELRKGITSAGTKRLLHRITSCYRHFNKGGINKKKRKIDANGSKGLKRTRSLKRNEIDSDNLT